MTRTYLCAECGKPADITMLCPVCRMLPEYGGPMPRPIEDDECPCISCRSDVAGIVPCLKENGVSTQVFTPPAPGHGEWSLPVNRRK